MGSNVSLDLRLKARLSGARLVTVKFNLLDKYLILIFSSLFQVMTSVLNSSAVK